jgi:phospholipid/cholesterol/gamma-HCH transport system ATP-binding protein
VLGNGSIGNGTTGNGSKGAEIRIEGLGKSFGLSNVWSDLNFTVPAGEITALLGPSGTGKSVFLRCVLGLLKPDCGSILVHGQDLVPLKQHQLREVRKQFGVLFQDSGLFGSINLFDNVAYPLREHTKLKEREIRDIVLTKLDLLGLGGSELKLPGELSGGMRKRAGLARALVMDPRIVLLDEPDSGLDPVRIANLTQLIVDLNAVTGATFLFVTHNVTTARLVPDNIGIMYRRELAIFGPREIVLTSEDPVVSQFLNGRREGPIGMFEERDAPDWDGTAAPSSPLEITPQLTPSNGRPRAAEFSRLRRVESMLDQLPGRSRSAIRASFFDVAARAVPPPRSASPGESLAARTDRPSPGG